jgi:hypothetical protein
VRLDLRPLEEKALHLEVGESVDRLLEALHLTDPDLEALT